MDKIKDLRAGIDEMRSVAQRLLSWAEDMERSLKNSEPAEAPAPEKPEVTRADLKALLTKRCAAGYSAQVKALIASYGASTLSAVPEEALGDLWDAALLLGEEERDGDGHAG